MLNMALTCLREMKTSCTRSSLSSRLPKREVAVCFISLTVIFEFCCKGMKKPFKTDVSFVPTIYVKRTNYLHQHVRILIINYLTFSIFLIIL